jgi:ATP-dependent exoDNAse (exonuclease V) beta subunit
MSIDQFYENEPAEQPPVPEVTPTEAPKKLKSVSFSQYAMWLKCPQQWKLAYIDKLAPYEASINTVFGDGVHAALQEYLRLLYNVSTEAADKFDYYAEFTKVFDEGLKDLKLATEEQLKLTEEELDDLDLVTPTRIEEFRNDGRTILDHVTSYAIRKKHFPSKQYEVLGIELPLEIPLRGGTIMYKGFLDIVLKDKTNQKILILDFKTSTRGWNKYQKMDRTKIDQLLLYKRFYHQMFKVPMNDIEVEFFVVKRKLLEDVDFPQQRIQRIAPPDGKLSMKEVEIAFLEFINSGFTLEGEYNVNGSFPKNPEKGRKNCKYCVFKTLKSPEGKLYCDGKEG